MKPKRGSDWRIWQDDSGKDANIHTKFGGVITKMTLQQLRYIVQISALSSVSRAARNLNLSQACVSVAVNDLEKELGLKIFERTSTGMKPTSKGLEIIGHAQEILQHAELLEQTCRIHDAVAKFSVSSQHYTFVSQAFLNLCSRHEAKYYDFTLREIDAQAIINEVARGQSEVGILFYSAFNKKFLSAIFASHGLESIVLLRQKPHVFLAPGHPLAGKACIGIDELNPYPCVIYDRGAGNSYFFSEEMFSNRPLSQKICVSDRETAANSLSVLNAYNIGTGIFNSGISGKVIAIPLDTEEELNIAYIKKSGVPCSAICEEFLALLDREIENETVS